MFYACKSGNKAIVIYLVEHGANIYKINCDCKTPLFIACENGQETVVKYLVEQGANLNIAINYYNSCILKRDRGETVLFKACESGNEAIVKFLIEHGTDM